MPVSPENSADGSLVATLLSSSLRYPLRVFVHLPPLTPLGASQKSSFGNFDLASLPPSHSLSLVFRAYFIRDVLH